MAAKGYFINGPYNLGAGICTVIRHPVKTAQGVGYLVRHPIQGGKVIVNEIEGKLETVEGQSEVAFDVATIIVSFAKGPKIAKTGNEAAKASEVAQIAQKTSRVIPGSTKIMKEGLDAASSSLSKHKDDLHKFVKDKDFNAGNEIRERLFKNLEESKIARESSNFDHYIKIEERFIPKISTPDKIRLVMQEGLPDGPGALYYGGAYDPGTHSLFLRGGGHVDALSLRGVPLAETAFPYKECCGISAYIKDGRLFWANDSRSLMGELSAIERLKIQIAFEEAYPNMIITPLNRVTNVKLISP